MSKQTPGTQRTSLKDALSATVRAIASMQVGFAPVKVEGSKLIFVEALTRERVG